MNNVTLRQMRYVQALARQGHFGRAAELCAVTQPALSMQVRELEQTLGAALFERGPRQVRLTAFGEDVLVRINAILQQVDELGDLARAAQDGLAGRLRIGVIPTIAPYLLPAMIGEVTLAFPALDLHVRETVTPTLLHELLAGQLDAAVLALPVSEPALEEAPLFSEDFVLVRPQSDAHRPVPDADALREMRLLLLEEGHCFRDQALSFCSLRPNVPREDLDGSSLTTLVQMVGAGIGVTLIPEMAVTIETRSANVAIQRFEAPRPSRQVGMVWRRSSPLASEFMAVADVVRAAHARRKGESAWHLRPAAD